MKKRWWRGLLWGLGIPLGLGSLYLLMAFIGGRVAVHRAYQPSPDGVPVYLWSNGVHVDLLLPARRPEKDWTTDLPPTAFQQPPANWVAMGWGELNFYQTTPTWQDLKIGVALQAVLWPTPSAMHVTYLSAPPPPGEHCRPLRLSTAQYRKLVAYLEGTFYRDAEDRLCPVPGSGYAGTNDAFFQAVPRYHLFRTCNHWTGKALKAAEVRTGWWTPFAGGILRHHPLPD